MTNIFSGSKISRKVVTIPRWLTVALSALLALLLLTPLNLLAENKQDYEKDKTGEITLDEMVVTASRTERPEKEISTNITIITKDDIKRYGATDITDLLRHVPGLTLNPYGGERLRLNAAFRGMQPNIRGVLVMQDGFELNSPSNVLSMLNIPFDRIERIEVVKTPSSVLYGPNGVGGVINIITRKPKKEIESKATMKYGSYDYYEPSLYAGGVKDNRLLYSLDYMYQETNGYRDNNALRHHMVNPRFEYIGNNYDFEIYANFQDYNGQFPGGVPVNEYKENPKKTYQEGNTADITFVNIASRFEWEIDSSSKVQFKSSFRDQELYGEDLGFEVDYDTLYTFTAESIYQRDFTLLQKKNRFLLGAEYRRQSMRVVLRPDDFWTPFVPLYYDWDVEEDTLGFFAQEEVNLTESILFHMGARYDIISTDYKDNIMSGRFDTTHQKWSPRIGFSYQAASFLNIYGNYSEGIRTVLTSMNSFTFHTNLRPEREESYEIGVRGNISGNISYSVATFLIKSRNKIIETMGRFLTENAGEAESKGVEASFRIALPYNLYTDLSYTYQDAEFEEFESALGTFDNNEVPLVPKNMLGLSTGWNGKKYGAIDITLNYSDERYIDIENLYKLDDYTVVNMKYSNKWKSFKYAFSVNNIFDADYGEFGEAQGGLYAQGPVAYPADGRTAYMSISYEY